MTFVIPKVKTCCCGCSLKLGSKFIAYFYVIGGFSLILFAMVISILRGSFASISFVLAELTYTSETFFSSILLYGIHKDLHILILPWVLFQSISIGRNIVSVFLYLILHVYGFHNEQTMFEFTELVLTSYFVLIIYNYYRELKSNCSYPPSSVQANQC